MRFNILLCIMLAMGLTLQGCGRKGPLKLPQSAPPVIPSGK